MNTKHGYHIPGTERNPKRPKFIKRCGGVHNCAQCKAEWQKKQGEGK